MNKESINFLFHYYREVYYLHSTHGQPHVNYGWIYSPRYSRMLFQVDDGTLNDEDSSKFTNFPVLLKWLHL